MQPSLVVSVVGWSVLLAASPALAAAQFVGGAVPDWDQPYLYGPPISVGPGPDPTPGVADPFDAWCAPTAAANLIGHWEDFHGEPVGDGMAFPLTPAFGVTSWHDFELDQGRPASGPPGPLTDVGWYMDTSNSGDSTFGNPPHLGTFVQDTHLGLANLLNAISSGWNTGTRGTTFGLGTESGGGPAVPHPDAVSAFAEAVQEIDADRTLLITWQHWNAIASGVLLGGDPTREFFTFGGNPGTDPWGNDEDWDEPVDPKLTLGHVTTAVGYIQAGDPDDPGRDATGTMVGGPMPTDWVIVHDNVAATPRDVIVPLTLLEYGSPWLANTNAIRTPQIPSMRPALALVLAVALAALVLRRGIAADPAHPRPER